MRLHQAFKFILNVLVVPRSSNKDAARREFILNILLVGLLVLAAVGFFINVARPFLNPSSAGQSPFVTGFVLVFISCLLVASRLSWNKLVARLLIWFLFAVGLFMTYFWGADLPALLLFFALLIVMAGILINSTFAFALALLCGGNIIIFTYLELAHYHKPHNEWKGEAIKMTDAIIYALTLGIISVVAWLSNREMEKALKRASSSEAAVKRQRDNLEVLIEERTHELKRLQAEKFTQLYRFAEFGRMASGLFHDLSNPLTLVSLNLDRLQRQSKNMDQQKILDTKTLLKRALNGTQRLEKFIIAARKQVQNQDSSQIFSMKEEVEQAVQLLEFKARKMHVTFEVEMPRDISFYGSSVKFNQLMTNLVSNAIDSYVSFRGKGKTVAIRLHKVKNEVQLEVQDWGSGIAKKDLPHIFEPLFTTKPQDKGMGMGLSITRDIVEKYFKGQMQVVSNKPVGTVFTIRFPIKKKPKEL